MSRLPLGHNLQKEFDNPQSRTFTEPVKALIKVLHKKMGLLHTLNGFRTAPLCRQPLIRGSALGAETRYSVQGAGGPEVAGNAGWALHFRLGPGLGFT